MGRNDRDTCWEEGECLFEVLRVEGGGGGIHESIV